MTPAGFMAKRVVSRPDWLAASQVVDIYSVSGCASPFFADYTGHWLHNGYWFFDRPETIRRVAMAEQVPLASCHLFFLPLGAGEGSLAGGVWVRPFSITSMGPADWESVRRIYLEGMATRQATFETAAPSWETWDAGHLPEPRLIARDGEQVLGWAGLSPVSRRAVYAGVAEVSLYVSAAVRRIGVGRALLLALIDASEAAGIWTLQGGVFPENIASIALQKSCGFREVGVRERLGRLDGVWRDVLLMERRSTKVGA